MGSEFIEPSRPLGSSNADVFGRWLGHSGEELAAYRANGVIGPPMAQTERQRDDAA